MDKEDLIKYKINYTPPYSSSFYSKKIPPLIFFIFTKKNGSITEKAPKIAPSVLQSKDPNIALTDFSAFYEQYHDFRANLSPITSEEDEYDIPHKKVHKEPIPGPQAFPNENAQSSLARSSFAPLPTPTQANFFPRQTLQTPPSQIPPTSQNPPEPISKTIPDDQNNEESELLEMLLKNKIEVNDFSQFQNSKIDLKPDDTKPTTEVRPSSLPNYDTHNYNAQLKEPQFFGSEGTFPNFPPSTIPYSMFPPSNPNPIFTPPHEKPNSGPATLQTSGILPFSSR